MLEKKQKMTFFAPACSFYFFYCLACMTSFDYKTVLLFLGIWGYLSSSIVPENLEQNVSYYLSRVQQALGEKMFLEIYFETLTDDEYLENLDELNRASLLEDLHSAKELLGKSSFNFISFH